jgi:iron complex outermembrane receptor protein
VLQHGLRLFSALLLPVALFAQTPRRETVVVTGSYEPLALEEVDRSVTVLPARDQSLVLNTLTDLLQLDPSLDVRRRAPDGVQTDLSIRGSSFGQTLVLLNGQRLNDAQSGHHNMDIPLPLESISRVEVLRGSGSTLYGADAVGGAINIITSPPETPELRLRTAAGNFGVNQQRGTLTLGTKTLSEQLTFSRDFSTGFRDDRDYRNLALASSTHLVTPLGASDLTVGYMDHPFGADQFYGNFNSWENTKTWFASMRQSIGQKTTAAVSFRRHSDLFVLYRDRPAVFANHHAVEAWQMSLRRKETVGTMATVHYGVEGFHESITSNNLGDHARSRAAAYAGIDFRALKRFSLSLSGREEVYRRVSGQFCPTVAGGVWLSPHFKLRASASRAFRVPTYTDLYYHDPANLGSPDLRPERAWSYEGALDWHASNRVKGEVTVFERRERDGIDYIRHSLTDIWRAANIQNLHFTGVEASIRLTPRAGQQIDFRYTGLKGAQDAVANAFSKYVFNYPTHSGVAAWSGSLRGGVLLRTRIGVLDRRARDPYALWDFYAASSRGRVRPFLQFANITSTRYEEILGVAMPGRSVVGGVELVVFKRR